ncbi:MAG: APC family permease [Candidatus Tectomicrobia bacterium]|uniref:APC family permease n=1 Tax=Tectimicrobiota bacterium TaxID=2528274 RepID=A0A932GP35_UNCTE|nr:APC family permease [Candidatus Tectomicrobia bacterium]
MPNSLKRLILGSPLATWAARHERLGKITGLAVFASDALSSVAYATEEILLVLVTAGAAALTLSLPLAVGIATLVVIVATSYWQTIHAYPSGGGAYIVASDNLGRLPGLVAGSALLIDYVLTVAVSVAAGVAAITSAFPALFPWRVALGVLTVVGITVANLRGVRESGRLFAVPTYWFIGSLLLLILAGFFRVLTGTVQPLPPEELQATHAVSLFLIMRAFSSGCVAITGTEAVSNGIPAFRPPESRNAGIVLGWMAAILASSFLSTTYLARVYQVVPRETETVVSILAGQVFGKGLLYYNMQAATALILLLAANTSFADFPRLSSIMARDGFMPRQLANRGDKLVFSNGILILAGLSILLLVIFRGSTHALIPLYAVGVFLSFTLSQAGMVRHWLTEAPPALHHIALNGLGALATGIVMVIIAVSKFALGAWVVVLLIPLIVFALLRIHRHYDRLASRLSLEGASRPKIGKNPVVVLVAGIHRGVVEALEYAKSLSPNVTALTVDLDSTQTAKLRLKWAEWAPDVPLVVLESPYRSILQPLLEYIDRMERQGEGRYLTVVLPEIVPSHWWEHFLHNQTALLIKAALLFRPGKITVSVPYHVED